MSDRIIDRLPDRKDKDELLFRLTEFRIWVQTNVLFPTIPDSIVHPILENLRKAEHILIAELYDRQEFRKILAMLADKDGK
jgi:hypothetical protein